MTSGIGIAFDGFTNAKAAVEVAKEAAKAGAGSFWLAEHLGYRSAAGTAMAFAMAAPGPMLVPTAISPYLWHPTAVAMELGTLDDIVPGAVGIAIGVGNPLFLQENGRSLDRPIVAVREFVDALRRLWTGEPVHMDGEFVKLAGARMAFRPSRHPVIYIAATGPDMLKATGRFGDGVVLSAGLSRESVAHSLRLCQEGAEKAGRDHGGFRKAGYIFFSVGESSREARDRLRPKLAFVMRNKFLADNIRQSGIPIDHEAIVAAVARRDIAAATALIPDEAIEAFGIAGTRQECRDALLSFIEHGIEEPVLSLIGEPPHHLMALDVLRELSGVQHSSA